MVGEGRDGEIGVIEEGTYCQLLEMDGKFKTLVAAQLGSREKELWE
jgi:hypothetical protein